MQRGVLARDAGTTKDSDAFPSMVFTHTAESHDEVDALLTAAAGGRITVTAAETSGGAYSGSLGRTVQKMTELSEAGEAAIRDLVKKAVS